MRFLLILSMLFLPVALGGCACSLELAIDIKPRQVELTTGETVTPKVELSSCGGWQTVSDTFTWTAEDPSVASVDSSSGLITAQAIGNTFVYVEGKNNRPIGSIEITVNE